MLANFLKTSDMEIRLKKLLYDKAFFEHYPPYWYYLGDAYQETGDTINAVEAFEMYTKLYNTAPIYRLDKRIGVIQLRLLKIAINQGNISYKDALIKMKEIRKNLPNNGGAYLSCAAILAENFKKYEEAMDLLQEAVLKDNVSNKTTSALALILIAQKNKNIKFDFNLVANSINNIKQVDLYLLLMYYQETKNIDIENNIKDIIINIDKSTIRESWDVITIKANQHFYFDIDKLNLKRYKIALDFDDGKLDEFEYTTTSMKLKSVDGIKKDDLIELVEEIAEKNNDDYLFTDNTTLMNTFFKENSELLTPINTNFNDTEACTALNDISIKQTAAVEKFVNEFLNRKYSTISLTPDIVEEKNLINDNTIARNELCYYKSGLSEIKDNNKPGIIDKTVKLANKYGLNLKYNSDYKSSTTFHTTYSLKYDNFSYTFLNSDDKEELKLIMIKNRGKVLFFNKMFKEEKINSFINKNESLYILY